MASIAEIVMCVDELTTVNPGIWKIQETILASTCLTRLYRASPHQVDAARIGELCPISSCDVLP